MISNIWHWRVTFERFPISLWVVWISLRLAAHILAMKLCAFRSWKPTHCSHYNTKFSIFKLQRVRVSSGDLRNVNCSLARSKAEHINYNRDWLNFPPRRRLKCITSYAEEKCMSIVNFTFYKNWISPPSDHEALHARENDRLQLQLFIHLLAPRVCEYVKVEINYMKPATSAFFSLFCSHKVGTKKRADGPTQWSVLQSLCKNKLRTVCNCVGSCNDSRLCTQQSRKLTSHKMLPGISCCCELAAKCTADLTQLSD